MDKLKIVDFEEKGENVWETPFDVKLQKIFTYGFFIVSPLS